MSKSSPDGSEGALEDFLESQDSRHFSVLRAEVIESLDMKEGEIFVDGTFGAGGYSRAVLESSKAQVYGIDRDPNAAQTGREFEQEFSGRFKFLQGKFSEMEALLQAEGISKVDAIALDIGVSSMQFDEAERGFSFSRDAPLDMRMSCAGQSAADVVNLYGEEELANIIYKYGEERKSRWIAKAIVRYRKEQLIERTLTLAGIIEGVLGKARFIKGKKQIHPATRTFQALRIYINDELGELEKVLEVSERILNSGGRLCAVSFHSLEDRIVKQFFKLKSGGMSRNSRYLPEQTETNDPTFKLIFKGGKKPQDKEMKLNPRSRSAKLRAGIRTQAAIVASE